MALSIQLTNDDTWSSSSLLLKTSLDFSVPVLPLLFELKPFKLVHNVQNLLQRLHLSIGITLQIELHIFLKKWNHLNGFKSLSEVQGNLKLLECFQFLLVLEFGSDRGSSGHVLCTVTYNYQALAFSFQKSVTFYRECSEYKSHWDWFGGEGGRISVWFLNCVFSNSSYFLICCCCRLRHHPLCVFVGNKQFLLVWVPWAATLHISVLVSLSPSKALLKLHWVEQIYLVSNTCFQMQIQKH